MKKIAAALGLALCAAAPLRAMAAGTVPLEVDTADGRKLGFVVEVAATAEEQQTGLMWRRSVPADGGMLFVFHGERKIGMWMKNTLVPLDMLFVAADGTIRSVAHGVPQSLEDIASPGPVLAVVELAGGTAERLGIRPGDKVASSGLR
jgi:uncharacterized membrane protein (UPF0127 family)